MDAANPLEALREMEQDLEEGADLVMVKPSLTALDVITRAKAAFRVPVWAYHVSGEYSMVEAARRNGWLDGDRAQAEALTAIKRAGADRILTYWAVKAATYFKGAAGR
jgi:porphobilinogen synthase